MPERWQPIATAPKMRTILLFAVTHVNDDGTVGNWKMATGAWHTGYEDALSKGRGFTPWEWGGHQLRTYDVQPTHWMPIPQPPDPPGVADDPPVPSSESKTEDEGLPVSHSVESTNQPPELDRSAPVTSRPANSHHWACLKCGANGTFWYAYLFGPESHAVGLTARNEHQKASPECYGSLHIVTYLPPSPGVAQPAASVVAEELPANREKPTRSLPSSVTTLSCLSCSGSRKKV